MNLINGRIIPSTQISIRSYSFATNEYNFHYNRSNGEVAKEFRIRLCEPCTFTIDVLVPYELDVFDNRGIETQIWTNLCDKYSSTGRWHAIQARRMEIHKELRGRVHSFSVSVIPIRCGVFEFTARTRAPKSGNCNWIWADLYEQNEVIHVIRTGSQRVGLTQGSVRQLAQWFDDTLLNWYFTDIFPIKEHKTTHSILSAYTAAFLSVIALQEGMNYETCMVMNKILSENEWLNNKTNTLKVLAWCIGSTYLANSLAASVYWYVLSPITPDDIRRIRSNSIDRDDCIHQIPVCLLTLVHNSHYGSIRQTLLNTKNPIVQQNRLSSILENDHQNDVLMEFLLAFVKSNDLSFFSHSFFRKLIHTLTSIQNQLIRLYIQRIFRCLYEKEMKQVISKQSYITLCIIESFELYNECVINEQDRLTSKEIDTTIEGSSDGGPLFSLLSLIRLLYITHLPIKMDLQEQINHHLENQLVICSCLLRVFARMSDEHPDFLKMKDLLLSFAHQDPKLTILIAKRLVSLKTDYSNNHSYYLCIIEHLLIQNYSLFSTHLPLLNRVMSYIIHCMHSENVYVILKALQVLDFQSKPSIWRFVLLCKTQVIDRFSEYLDEDENHWLSNIRVTAQQLHTALEIAGILKNGIFNADGYSSNPCVSFSYTATCTTKPAL